MSHYYGTNGSQNQANEQDKLDKDMTKEQVHNIRKEEIPKLASGQSAGTADPKERLDKAATEEESHSVTKQAVPKGS